MAGTSLLRSPRQPNSAHQPMVAQTVYLTEVDQISLQLRALKVI